MRGFWCVLCGRWVESRTEREGHAERYHAGEERIPAPRPLPDRADDQMRRVKAEALPGFESLVREGGRRGR